MRNCPVCESPRRDMIFEMSYRIPDSWTLPSAIQWYTCNDCGFLYGDGEFSQADLDTYYRERYGYGLNSAENVARLKSDAERIALNAREGTVVVDFGGGGDDGESVVVNKLRRLGVEAYCVGAGDPLPYPVDVIYASHVIEHIYDLPQTMERLSGALDINNHNALLIIDGPDATGLLQKWRMPILDFNTKHINHFTLRDYLNLGHRHGFELIEHRRYELHNAPCYQLHFKRLDVARMSEAHIAEHRMNRLYRLSRITEPVNVWGLGDITWHLLSLYPLEVLDYIDNDPAYRGTTYNGKPVQERPTNDAPIVILAQGQRKQLIENIRKAGVVNDIIEI